MGVLRNTLKEKKSRVCAEEDKMKRKGMHRAPDHLVLPEDYEDMLLEDETLRRHDDPYSNSQQ